MMTTINPIPEILAFLQNGQLTDVERLCREGLHQAPDNADLLVLLAIALHQQRRVGDALAIYARLTELHPESALHWGNYATALRDAGQLSQAEQAIGTLQQLAPDLAGTWIQKGLLLLQQRDFLNARSALLHAVELEPQLPAARIHAARACLFCRDYRADEFIRPWRNWLPLDNDLQQELADLHLALGDAATAQFLLEDLNARSPSQRSVQLLLAAVYERVNQREAALRMLETLSAERDMLSNDEQTEMAHQYALLALREGRLPEAREMLEHTGARHSGDYAHYFTLAEVCDKQGDCDAALRALRVAHERQLEELATVVPYRFQPDAPVLPAAVGRVSRDDYKSWPALTAPDSEYSPVFIVGFPRSGTTLLEQMLDAHPLLQSMDERPFFNILSDQLDDYGIQMPRDICKLDQYACDELRKGYLRLVSSKIERRWNARLVDKNPLNMLWLPMIHRLFPKAKFILALRHPCDVIVSNYMQNYQASVLAIANSSLEKLASAYVAAMECWLHHVEVIKPDLLVSRYEELVDDPEVHTRRIAEFLGLEDASPMLDFDQHARKKGFIATPSYTQVIQPVNRKGLNRWMRYRDVLAPILPAIQPMLDHWGYSMDLGDRALLLSDVR